jgi:hypothetical protein
VEVQDAIGAKDVCSLRVALEMIVRAVKDEIKAEVLAAERDGGGVRVSPCKAEI